MLRQAIIGRFSVIEWGFLCRLNLLLVSKVFTFSLFLSIDVGVGYWMGIDVNIRCLESTNWPLTLTIALTSGEVEKGWRC